MPPLTLMCCRPAEDCYILMSYDLEDVRAWGSRQHMGAIGVRTEVIDLASTTGSATLSAPPEPGHYGWGVNKVQAGDWLVDRSLADQYCEAREADADFDPTEFLVGDDEDVEIAEFNALYAAGLACGASESLARQAAELGIHPDMVTGGLEAGEAFIGAASFHDVEYAAGLLEAAKGDPQLAWEMWADSEEGEDD